MKRVVVLVVLIFYQNMFVALSQINSIKGIVVSEEQIPIEFANVVLSDRDGQILKGTITDSLGRFHFILDDYIQSVDKILTVSYIGYETYKQPVEKKHIGEIVLHTNHKMLQEVVVTGRDSPYTMKGATLVANVQRSILKDAGNAEDVLKQLPLISIKNDMVSVFGKGDALIYINNKEVRNIDELQRLSSKNIKKIDIITVPGAQYSASIGAVIKIYTIAPPAGFSGLIHSKVQRGENWSEFLLASISYAKNKFVFFADYSVQDLRKIQKQETDVIINGSSQSIIHSYNRLKLSRLYHDLSVAAEYKIAEQHLVGFKCNHSFLGDGHYNISGAITAYYDSKKNADNQWSNYYPKGNNKNINVFYRGNVFGWDVDINTDYVFGHTKTPASYNQEKLADDTHSINSLSENDYHLGASKLELSRQIGNSIFSFGGDYIRTRNKSFYSNDDLSLQNDLPRTNTLNKQDLYALFLNYKQNLYRFNIELGLRYEFINQNYFINDVKKETQSKKYSNLFPAFNISRAFLHEKLNMSLSYRRVVNRPSYYQLRGDIQYNSPYSYEAGNPLLQNTYIDDISYMASYSNLSFIASYKSYHDKILFTIEQYKDKPITLSCFTNVADFKEVSLAAIWDPTFFKIWNPRIEFGFEKQFLKVKQEDVISTFNRPYFYFSLYNILKFTQDISFVIQSKYGTSYNSGVLREKSAMFVDAYIQKSFFKNSMVLKIGAENIFNTYKDKWTMRYKNIVYEKYANTDNRFVYISFIYNLHKTKKYTGKGTRNSERNRLNSL